ncbi:MAG: aspartyl protease family protein [Chitinophagaceae bacterium]|nr:aspartyl protease family protein [Chitinophagaceae bacterium]
MFSLCAQEEFVPAPSVFITKFPFRMLTGGIIIIKAQLNDYKDSLNFILDTGSGGISLDSGTVERMHIKSTYTDRTIRGIAGIRKVRFAFDNTLRLPGLKVDSLDFHINDYDLLTSVYGEKIDGIIGYSFLSRYIVHINYDSLKISVHTKGRIKYPRGGYLMKPFIVNIPVTNAQVKDINEVNSRFYFDTGAGMCVLLSSDFVEDSMMLRTKRKWYVSQAEGLGGKAPMKQGVLRQIRVGPYKFKNIPAYIFDDEYNITSYPYLGGLIGNDLLRRFNLILNYDKRDIHLLPNSHFREQFDYSYTGLGMYVVDGVIKVVDVMKNSPAEKAGFRSDDIIMAVGNNFSQNIQTYKNMMQNPRDKIKIIVYRNGRPVPLMLKVLSILR